MAISSQFGNFGQSMHSFQILCGNDSLVVGKAGLVMTAPLALIFYVATIALTLSANLLLKKIFTKSS